MSAADILGEILRANLAAGVAIVGVVALRKLARARFGARLAYGLWLLPVLAGVAVLLPAREVLVVQPTAPVLAAAPGALWASPSPHGAAANLDSLLLVGVWLIGVAGAALVMAILQHRFVRKARSGGVGPAVVGVIAPRILMPRDFAQRYSPGEQALVLAHEQAHIARQDSRLNGFCAAVQCLFWFNPLVHLAARLMRIDQELACDEAVVSRFPAARRAYAEVLVKAQLALLPLPLGCYWPPAAEHPLVERVAMLRRRSLGPARRSAGAAALAGLCVGVAVAAWAALSAEVRVVAPRPDRVAAADGLGAQTSDHGAVAPRPVKAVARTGSPARTPADLAGPTITDAPSGASPTPEGAVAEAVPVPASPVQDIAPPDGGVPPTAEPAAVQPALATPLVAAATPAVIKVSQKTGLADDPDQILCKVQPVTGSRFVKRICMTKLEWKQQQWRLLSFERLSLLDPSGYAAADY